MKTPTLGESELAWAAGFIEADGHVGKVGTRKRIDGGRNYHLMIRVTQSYYPERLKRIQRAIGQGRVNGPHSRGEYSWSVTFKSAREALVMLWPYFGPTMRRRIVDLHRQGVRIQ